MKLKTLKDLGKDRDTYSYDKNENVKYFDERVLKAEAIKWFLYAVKKKKNMYNMFMEFFNITQEDYLK